MLKMHACQVRLDINLGRNAQCKVGFWESKFSPSLASEFCKLAEVDAVDEPEDVNDGCIAL